MIVKLLKPVPMIDHVMQPGEIVDGDLLLQKLVKTGRAVYTDPNPTKPNAVPKDEPVASTAEPEVEQTAPEQAEHEKTAKPATKRKKAVEE